MQILEQSLVFILFIVVGILLQRKIADKSELKGVKLIILNIALPATIFVALLSVSLDARYLALPLGALLFNFIILGLTYFFAPLFGFDKSTREHRTMMLLIPSLAPGLSCFPFLSEFMGEDALALGALADVGNKFFVLIFCYMLALHWYQKTVQEGSAEQGKLKSLFLSMLNEPINLVMMVAILLILFGLNLDALPIFMQNSVLRASAMMTPLVLLFIGLSVKLKWDELQKVFSFLLWRSAIAFILSGVVILMLPDVSATMKMLILVLPQSAVSFWPYAHMSALDKGADRGVFNLSLAISVIACSLPYSTMVMLGLFSSKEIILENTWLPIVGGVILLLTTILPLIIRNLTSKVSEEPMLGKDPISLAE